MKKTVLFILGFLFLASFLSAQFWTENFSTGTQYTVTLGAEGYDSTQDYFIRTDDNTGYNIGPSYTGINGFFFAGQDIDDPDWTGSANPSELTWSNIDISGQTNLEFKGKFASVALEYIDNSDYLHVQYNIDSGGWTDLIWFENDGTLYNTYFLEDTDFSGDGEGTQLTSTFLEFTKTIPSTGSLLSLRITCAAGSGGEDFAFDDFQLFAAGGNSLPAITNIIQTPSVDTDITSSTTVSVSADVTDSDGTISLVELHWGTTSGILTNTINMSNTVGDTYVTDTDIPGQVDGTTVYYEVYAEDDVPESTTSAEYNYSVTDPATTTLDYFEDFSGGFADCYTYSVAGTNAWYLFSEMASVNGFGGDNPEEDWMIFPGINFDNYSDEYIAFNTQYKYGSDDSNNYLKLFYSTDYTGLGDPTSSFWTELIFTKPISEDTMTGSGNIDLSGITGSLVYIAFKYYSTDSPRRWQIDDVSITKDGPLPVNLSAFYALYIGGSPTLYWVTQTETENAYWNVYRGTNNNFTQAGHLNAGNPVPGNGTTNSASEYVYIDDAPVVQNTTYWYWIEDVSFDGETVVHEPITLTIPFEDTPITPDTYGLHQNYPNPFNPSTSISFALAEESDVELVIYNIKGAKIRTIFNDHVYADQVQSVIWDGNDSTGKQVSSGVYFYKLITETKEYQKKMLLVK